MFQKVLNYMRIHQRSDGRQTEYQRPRFSSRQCGSEQSFLRIAASAVGSEGGGCAELEHAARATIAMAKIAGLTSAPPWLLSGCRILGACNPDCKSSEEAILNGLEKAERAYEE